MKRIYSFAFALALFLGLMVGAQSTVDTVSADPIPGTRVQLPVIWANEGWETEIQVQNVGVTPTRVILFLWEPYSGKCEAGSPGPIITQCSINVKPGTSFSWTLRDVGEDSMSGIVYSVAPERALAACEAARDALGDTFKWLEWEREWDSGASPDLTFGDPDGARGQPLAVTVTRFQIGEPGEFPRTSAYSGLTEEMEGVPDETGTFTYFAPLNFDTYNPTRWQTTIYAQNSGDACTYVEVWFQRQDECLERESQIIGLLAPGETAVIPSIMRGNGVGSAWLRSPEPLGVIVDEENAPGDVLMTYHGLPAALGSTVNHAPVIYKDFEGWNSGVQVQNLSRTFNAKVKVYFLDNSGGIITSIVDWICPQGSRTYFLPVLANLPRHYAGAVRVESQAWLSPGGFLVEAPEVFSVVNLVNYLTRQAVSYNAFPEKEVLGVDAVALPSLVKEGTVPLPDSITRSSEILIQNINPANLGDATVRLDLFDANGLVDSICQTIGPNSVDLVDMDNVHILPIGWVGSGIVTWQCGGSPAIDVLVVERTSGIPFSDLSKGYQGTPLSGGFPLPNPIQCASCP